MAKHQQQNHLTRIFAPVLPKIISSVPLDMGKMIYIIRDILKHE